MHLSRIAAVAVAAASVVATAGLAPAAQAQDRTAAGRYADDFDGDGYRDFAHPVSESAGAYDTEAVEVVYGAPAGPGTRTQLIDEDSPGVPGEPEWESEGFGKDLAAADFDGDGYGDLAVGVRGESDEAAGRVAEGAVTVLWGGPGGLSGGTSVPNTAPKAAGYFGDDLATGDFDGDGHADLAATNGFRTFVHLGPLTRGGSVAEVVEVGAPSFRAVHLIPGHVTRDDATDLVIVGSTVAPDLSATCDAWFVRGGDDLRLTRSLRLDGIGAAMGAGGGVIADFDRDGRGDVAIGTPMAADHEGAVTLWRGGDHGPRRAERLTRATPGVAGDPAPQDGFGQSLSAADVDGDRYPDLAVGAPGETVGGTGYAGGVHLLYGGRHGLAAAGSQWLNRTTPGVPGDAQYYDSFGEVVRLRDSDRDRRADLFVTGSAGSLRLPGTAAGIDAAGAAPLPSAGFVSFPQ